MDGRKRKGGAARERIKKRKALATDAAKCCKISDMFASKGPGGEGSSSSTRASGAPAERDGGQFRVRLRAGTFSTTQNKPLRVIPNVFHSKDGTKRKWLTYNEVTHSLFCSVCFAFAKPSASHSAFVKGGMQAWKHAHQRVREHERSKTHRESAEAFFLRASKADIRTLLSDKQMSVQRDQVRKRRQVMERVIDVVKVIGKCGLSYTDTKLHTTWKTWPSIMEGFLSLYCC